MRLDPGPGVLQMRIIERKAFAAVALRVMAKTNPSKLKSEMVTVGISALL